MSKSIRVEILDREYPLRVREENEERTRRVAAAVDARMESIRKQLPTEPDLTIAVMAALAYGEELAALREASESHERDALSQIDSMLSSLSTVVE
jgi:cell division protein ZapA